MEDNSNPVDKEPIAQCDVQGYNNIRITKFIEACNRFLKSRGLPINAREEYDMRARIKLDADRAKKRKKRMEEES